MEDVNKKCGNIAYAAIPIPQRARADERARLLGGLSFVSVRHK